MKNKLTKSFLKQKNADHEMNIITNKINRNAPGAPVTLNRSKRRKLEKLKKQYQNWNKESCGQECL